LTATGRRYLDRKVEALRPNNRQTVIDLAIDVGNLAAIARGMTPPDLTRAAGNAGQPRSP
jgi:hypothetical protein